MMIRYTCSLEGVSADDLNGFFVGWPNPPDAETHLKILEGSDRFILAIDEDTGAVIGFITAITDKVLAAYIPLLEVLPAYQGRGIGKALVTKMLAELEMYYMIDLLCDASLTSFYEKLGLISATGMMKRNYAHQAGNVSG